MLPDPLPALTDVEIARRLRAYARGVNSSSVSTSDLLRLRRAAVLVPLVWDSAQWNLLFTRRTETVQSHRGQVAFPGGAMDPGDASPVETALREAYEEVGLSSADVQVLGTMADFPTISDYLVTPVVGQVKWPFEMILSQAEVSRVFTIPLGWLADPQNHEERRWDGPGGRSERVIYYREYEGELLWGLSARITVDLLRLIGLLR